MLTNNVKLNLRPGGGAVVMDDEVVNGVRGLDLSAEAGEIPRLTLDLLVCEVEVEGQATVTIPDGARETLIKLGWTPPSSEF